MNLVYPLLAMVLLTFLVWIHMYVIRITEVSRRSLDIETLSPFNPEVGKRFLTSGDNFRNLFEMPVLFYVAIALALIVAVSDKFFLGLAWAFVALRWLHSIIHVSYNRILHRFVVYAASSIALFVMWARLAVLLVSNGEAAQ